MKTFLQHAKDTLTFFALSPSQIDIILSRVMASPSNDPFTGRWFDSPSDYPNVLTNLLERAILREALAFLEETLPEAWMIPAIRECIKG